ncbi:MAG TPA: glycosyltransferase [Candidatus Acidoferrales bacterium]|nr:glycosyltransferase [Candidatus Acidoferrales bacterium]
MMDISVVVPAYNAAPMIGDMLNALRRQSDPPPNLEIIVVDNGSTDQTADIVRAAAGVTLLHEDRRGPSAARNRGLRHACGDIVVHLDTDTLPTRTWLRNIVAPFANPQVVLAAGRTLIFRPATAVERYIAAIGLYDTDLAINRFLFPFVPSLNMAVRRSAALAVGGWAEELTTAEDVDFSHRLLKAYPSDIAYASNAVLFHRVRSTPQELVALAQTYGQGVARMYQRYSDEVRWDAVKTAKLRGRLAQWAILTAVLRAGRALRIATGQQLEFSQCHLMWSRNFARGFFDEYRGTGARATALK